MQKTEPILKGNKKSDNLSNENDEIVKKIIDVLDTKIRPQLQETEEISSLNLLRRV